MVTGGKASGPTGLPVHPAPAGAGSGSVDTAAYEAAAVSVGDRNLSVRPQSRANPSLARNPVTRSSSATAAAPAVTVS
ncbi:hypothetical protein GCM10010270_44490 [Streptomyces violaceus]|nr:hypothetical protein GCM10010270_44490 [Streptomyces janthinus]